MSNNMTEVRLLSVPLENDYKHTLYFETPEAQASYFIGKTVFSETDFTYQRKEGYIRYPKHFDDLQGCNYIMYRNNAYSNKWYYAFITEMVYKSDETSWIYFETDVIQTYLFNYTVKPSFVEREHVNDDTPGKHTFPENLEVGEYVSTFEYVNSDLTSLNIVVGVTELANSGEIGSGTYNGIYSGLTYYSFPNTDNKNELLSFLKRYSDSSKTTTEAIECMFLLPSFLCPTLSSEGPVQNPDDMCRVEQSYKTYDKTISFQKKGFMESIGGYTPKNNKLHCYPYRYLLLDNNSGASAVYQYEHFEGENIEFKMQGALTPGGSIRVIPKNYKSVDENDIEGLNLGKFPLCNWTTDSYTNWLTQNSVNIGLNIVAGAGQIIAGTVATVATGGVGGAIGGGQIVGGVSTIANQLAQIHQMSFAPNQSKGNLNCGDVITASHKNTLFIYGMAIKTEYLEIIDNYFSMFGYKCNRVKTPLKNHRNNFWYTKTIDVNIDGNIPSKDMQTIKNCYNNGLTFWKNPSNIGNYSVDNSII